jgi:ribose 5-phosphate isomerase B
MLQGGEFILIVRQVVETYVVQREHSNDSKGPPVQNKGNVIVVASDHAGFKLKAFIKKELEKRSIPVEDVGVFSEERSDYPIYIARAAAKVSSGAFRRGVVICGSGIGASIVANRFKNVRAALCVTPEMAELSRRHNDSNVLAMGERITSEETAAKILSVWLDTPFDGGRHETRVRQIDTVDGTQ